MMLIQVIGIAKHMNHKAIIMIKLLTGILISLALFSCSQSEKIIRTSIFELIAHSDQYDKRKIRVIGFLNRRNDIGYYLYPYEVDMKINDLSRRIRIDAHLMVAEGETPDFSNCSNYYVIVEGTFYSTKVVNAGIISDVQMIRRKDDSAIGEWAGCYTTSIIETS